MTLWRTQAVIGPMALLVGAASAATADILQSRLKPLLQGLAATAPWPAQRSNLVDNTIEDVVRSTPSSAPIRSVSTSISPTEDVTASATRS